MRHIIIRGIARKSIFSSKDGRRDVLVCITVAFLLSSCMDSDEPEKPLPRPASVKVAAVQFHSEFGRPDKNRKRMVAFIEKAAEYGVKVIVFPEAAIPGYCDLSTETFWSSKKEEEKGYCFVGKVAESVPGVSTDYFAPIAAKHKLYLTVPVIEKKRDKYYNTAVLLGPKGKIRMVHRKVVPWTFADTYWMTEAEIDTVRTVETEYGTVGLMICRDLHKLIDVYGKKKADIVLHCVAWFGPNSGGWFDRVLAKKVRSANINLVLSNWTFDRNPGWRGYGFSRIIARNGRKISEAGMQLREEIVVGSFRVNK